MQACDVDNYHCNADESERDDKEATLHHIVHYVMHHSSDAVVFREYAVHDGDMVWCDGVGCDGAGCGDEVGCDDDIGNWMNV